MIEPWRMEEPGEFQATSASERDAEGRKWASAVEAELGLADWLQVSGGLDVLVPSGDDRGAELGLRLAPDLAATMWRAALGVTHEWALRDGWRSEATEYDALGGCVRWNTELLLDLGVTGVEDRALTHAGAALAGMAGRATALLELRDDFQQDDPIRLSPGVAWHPGDALELMAGAPIHFERGRARWGFALKLSAETGVFR